MNWVGAVVVGLVFFGVDLFLLGLVCLIFRLCGWCFGGCRSLVWWFCGLLWCVLSLCALLCLF